MRGLIQHWSVLAERALTDVYQIPDTVSGLHHRYDGSLTRSGNEPPDEVHKVLAASSKVVRAAWCRGSDHPKACPDARAWRNLCTRAALLNQSRGLARLQLLVSLRKWRPPIVIQHADSTLATALKLKEAARHQRRFWRQLKPDDIDYIELQPLIEAAQGIAEALEKRYKEQSSKAWARWCQSSLATGGKAVIRWMKAPERGLQAPCYEAPGRKLDRITEEWQGIWGVPPAAAKVQPIHAGPELTLTSLAGPASRSTHRAASALAQLPEDCSQQLPPITTQELTCALGSFHKDTAVGADHWKPHELLNLSPTGLSLLAAILNLAERAGYPLGDLVDVVFLDKPGGVSAPLGCYAPSTAFGVGAEGSTPEHGKSSLNGHTSGRPKESRVKTPCAIKVLESSSHELERSLAQAS